MTEVYGAINAATAAPILWGSEIYKGSQVLDAGTTLQLNPELSIKRCLEDVEEQDIILDVINVTGKGMSVVEGEIGPNRNGWNDGWNHIDDLMTKYPKVQFRYLMAPSKKEFDECKIFETDLKKVNKLLEAGRNDAA